MRQALARILSGLLPAPVTEDQQEVYVLVIQYQEHERIHISAHSSEHLTKEALLSYVLDFKDDAADPDALDEALRENDTDKMIDAYFFENDEESYHMVRCEVDKE